MSVKFRKVEKSSKILDARGANFFVEKLLNSDLSQVQFFPVQPLFLTSKNNALSKKSRQAFELFRKAMRKKEKKIESYDG